MVGKILNNKCHAAVWLQQNCLLRDTILFVVGSLWAVLETLPSPVSVESCALEHISLLGYVGK